LVVLVVAGSGDQLRGDEHSPDDCHGVSVRADAL
jgi:hypothetical protein